MKEWIGNFLMHKNGELIDTKNLWQQFAIVKAATTKLKQKQYNRFKLLWCSTYQYSLPSFFNWISILYIYIIFVHCSVHKTLLNTVHNNDISLLGLPFFFMTIALKTLDLTKKSKWNIVSYYVLVVVDSVASKYFEYTANTYVE